MANGFSITISAVDNASKVLDGVNKHLGAMQAPAQRFSKSMSRLYDLSGLKATRNAFGQLEQASWRTARSVAAIVDPLAAITGAATLAGIYKLVSAWGDWGSHLGITANIVGMTAQRLQSFQGAAQLAGSSADAMTQSLEGLSTIMYDAIGGDAPEAVALFNQLGISFQNARREAVPTETALRNIADAVARATNPQAQLRIIKAFHLDPSLLPLLQKGSKGFDELAAKAAHYGTITAAGVAAANRMRVAQTDLTLAVSGFTNSVAEQLAPVISPFLDQMAEWIAQNREWIATGIGEKVSEFVGYLKQLDFKAMLADLEAFAGRADRLAQAFGGWKRVLEGVVAIELTGWIGKALGPLTGMLRLMAMVPGSGVTAAELGAIGLADAAVGSVGTQGNVREGHGAFGKMIYDNSSALRYADNWLHGSVGARTATPSSRDTTERQAQAMAYFQTQGWSKAQAAGIVANITAESGFNPGAVGDSGAAFGLGQWHADRQANFAKWAGFDIRDPRATLDKQMGFYNYELTQGGEQYAGSQLRGAMTARDAGAAVSMYDERPAARGPEAYSRGTLGDSIFGSPGAPGASGKVDVAITVNGGAVSKTTARASGSVNPPKVATNNVGVGSGGT